MKALTNIFGKRETNKSINNFLHHLDVNALIKIKGGEKDDDDEWPPSTGGGN